MWTNCLGGKQAGRYKTLGHILLHFKANYIHNIINLTYRRPTCKICATFKRLPGLWARELRVCRLRDLTMALTLNLDHSSGKTEVGKQNNEISFSERMDEISDFYFRMQNLTKFIGENLKLICQLHVHCITLQWT